VRDTSVTPTAMARPGSGRRRPFAVVAVVLLAVIGAVFVNAFLVDRTTRAAVARDGGAIEATGVVPANVLVEGDGPTIVLIHGFGAALDWWDGIVPQLAEDHRIIRLDLIGHGGTEAPQRGYSIERQAALVAAVLDAHNADKVTVIGHSMGGEVATALAEARPERIDRMILIDTPPAGAVSFDTLTRLYLSPVVGPLLDRFANDALYREALAQGFAPGFDVPQRFVADLAQLTYPAAVAAHDGSFTFRSAATIPERLAALQPAPPLLVIFGRLDVIVPVAEAQKYRAVPGARIETIDGVGHSPMVEAPDRTLALIRAFLADGTVADN